jgi:protein-disulfide isomerase
MSDNKPDDQKRDHLRAVNTPPKTPPNDTINDSVISRVLAALPTQKGVMIAAPLLVGLAAVLMLASRPAPVTTVAKGTPVAPVQVAATTATATTAAPLAAAPAPTSAPAVKAAPSVAAAAVPASASSFSPAQRTEIEGMIKSYLINNPDVLVDVTKELEKRQAAMQADEHKKAIVEKKASIFAAPTDFALGSKAKGAISVVEFFDYNCGWCKKAVDDVGKLTAADPNVRVVFKELPIFGEDSMVAAKAAMASVKQGKYWDYHVALMKEKKVTKDNVYTIAEKVGLNVDKLKADMADPAIDAALKENAAIAQALAIEGTPGFIVDTKVNVGYVPVDGLKALIADVRKAGCQVC